MRSAVKGQQAHGERHVATNCSHHARHTTDIAPGLGRPKKELPGTSESFLICSGEPSDLERHIADSKVVKV